MRVLHVTLSFSPGGRREAITTLCAGLAERGIENYLCCLDCLGSTTDVSESLFVDTIELRRRRLLDMAALRRLRHFCLQHGIDIIHTHDAASQTTCALAMPRQNVPLLMSFHRSRNFESARLRDRWRNAMVGLRTSAIVTASTERRQHYRSQNQVPKHKVLLVPFGINLDQFHPDATQRDALHSRLEVPSDNLLVGVIGHFGTEKGVDIAIEAFQNMCRAHPLIKAHLVVLGTGSPERAEFLAGLIDPDLAARIHLVGFQAHPQDWTCGFDVLLHGARIEAFGLVLIEAMACGVPVVAPAVGGISDIVLDRECGRLVAKPDAELLAAALAELLENADQRTRMAHGALRRARQEYDQQRYVQRFENLYLGLLANERPD